MEEWIYVARDPRCPPILLCPVMDIYNKYSIPSHTSEVSTTREWFLTQGIQTLIIQNLKRGIGAHSMEKLKKKFQTIFLRPIEVNLLFCASVILTMQATNSLEDPKLDLQCILIQPQFTGSSRNRIAWRHRVSAQSFAQ